MSWFDRPFRLLALALGVALLSGCNVGPMYGPLAVNPAVLGDLQAIEVAPIPERLGHYVRNELIFALNGTGAQVAPPWNGGPLTLSVSVVEAVARPGYDSEDIVTELINRAEAGLEEANHRGGDAVVMLKILGS